MKSLIVENTRKIAILRANALGDFIVTLPAIHAIREAYPSAEIVLLGKPWHKEFLANERTPVNRVIVIPVTKGLREEANSTEDKKEQEAFFTEIRKEHLDIAIHFHGKGVAANPFIKKLGARVTIGMTCEEAESLDRDLRFYYYQNEMARYLEIASLAGARPVMLEPEVKVLEEDRKESRELLAKHGRRPYVVLHACGTDSRRDWTREGFSHTADLLAARNYQVVFTGSKDDEAAVSCIIAMMKYPAVNACGRLSLSGLTGLLADSALVISSDTGPLHLARAVKARTIGIYWAPNLINWGPLTRMDHRPVISWNMRCPICGIIPNDPWPFEPKTAECDHNVSFTQDITPQQVIEQANILLRDNSSPAYRDREQAA